MLLNEFSLVDWKKKSAQRLPVAVCGYYQTLIHQEFSVDILTTRRRNTSWLYFKGLLTRTKCAFFLKKKLNLLDWFGQKTQHKNHSIYQQFNKYSLRHAEQMCTHRSTHNTKHTYMIFITVTSLLSSKNEISRSSVVNTHNVTNPIQSHRI